MTKRERIEDLGRISVMLDQIYDHPIFELYNGAPKRIHEWWNTLSEDQRWDFINNVAYGLEAIHFILGDILSIAKGNEE